MPGVSVLPSTIHFVADWWQSAALFAAWDVSRQGTLLEGSPDSLAKLDAVLCEQLGGHTAQSSEHGPPGVDQLHDIQTDVTNEYREGLILYNAWQNATF